MAACPQERARRRRANNRRRIILEASSGNTQTLPSDISTLSLQETSTAGNLNQYAIAQGMDLDGSWWYAADELESGKIYGHEMTTAGDPSTLQTPSVDSGTNGLSGSELGIALAKDGSHVMYADYSANKVYMRELGTAWDLTTIPATDDSEYTLANSYTNYLGVDGESWVGLNGSRQLVRHTMSTAYDLSTSSVHSTSSPLTGFSPRGLIFDDGGQICWVLDSAAKLVYQYSLSVAWDMSTLTDDSNTLNVAATPGPLHMEWRDANSSLYVGYYSISAGQQIVRRYA